MRTHGEPHLANLTVEQLTISSSVDLLFDKQDDAKPAPKVAAATLQECSTPAPVSAFCPVANKSESGESRRDLPVYTVATSSGSVGGNASVDLFQDTLAYVQHCLGFVALPAGEFVQPPTDVTCQPLSYIPYQPSL